MSDAQQPLILKDFQNAVADSPHLGHALMRNIDIETFPGAMIVQKKMIQRIISSVLTTFTANAGTDVCTGAISLGTQSNIDQGLTFAVGAVVLSSSGTLPAGLSLNTIYYLIFVSTTTFKLATTQANALAGTAIDITDAGTGTHTITPIPIGTIKHITKDYKTGFIFAQDSNGRIWNSVSATATLYLLNNSAIDTGNAPLTNASGNGISIFQNSDASKSFIFSFRDALVDVAEVTSTANVGAPSWTNGWKSLNSAVGTTPIHYALLAQDNITYFCDGRFIGSIVENAGSVFAPGTPATYTYNNQALDTPQNEKLSHLEELGTLLYASGLIYNKIYPWDRISDSFNLPIPVPEIGIYKLKNLGNMIYITAGMKGNIYYTQGTYVKLFKSIPGYLTNNSGVITSSPVTWGGIAARNTGLLVGMAGQESANNGVYIIYPDGRIVQDNTPYSGATNVTAIFAEGDFYWIGYAGGIDYITTSSRQGSFASVYQSELFKVGNKTQKGTYSNCEVQLAKPATTGSVRVGYRRDDSSSFTVLATYACDGATTSFETDIGIIDIENIQFQVEFDTNVEISQVMFTP